MKKRVLVLMVTLVLNAVPLYAGNGDLIVDGKLGVGTTSSAHKLHVKGGNTNNLAIDNDGSRYTEIDIMNNGAAKVIHYWDNTDNQYRIYSASGSHSIALQLNGGNVGIGTMTPAHALDVNGQVYANNILLTSDERYKKNILPVQNSLSTLLKMEGVSYEWKKPEEYLGTSAASTPAAGRTTTDITALSADGIALRDKKPEMKNFPEGRQYGVLAQAMEKVLPEVVKTDDNGDKAVAYTGIIPVLIEAIKEQQAQIEQLKKQVANLQK